MFVPQYLFCYIIVNMFNEPFIEPELELELETCLNMILYTSLNDFVS